MSHVSFAPSNPAYTEAMRLDANGNLGIGGNGKSGTITLTDGIDSTTLTVHMVKGLQEVKSFLDYAEKCDSEVGKLWRAYKVSNKLET
jgi:hypothetical protein